MSATRAAIRARLHILVLREPPSANRYWRHVGPKVLLSREAREYREHVANACLLAGWRPTDFADGTPLAVTLTWYRSAKRGDLDNRIKQVLDALRGCAYADDKDIAHIEATRYEGNTAKMHVVIRKWFP